MSTLRLLFLFTFGVLGCGLPTLAMSDTNVVFVVDAALDSGETAKVVSIVTAVQEKLPAGAQTSLVVFDDVVQKMVPLALGGADQQSEFLKSLSSIKVSDTSSIASGLERGFDELKDRPDGTVIIFARGQIDTAQTDSRSKHKEWLDLVLLPDASDAKIAVSLFTPESGVDADIVNSVLGHGLNSHTLLTPEAQLPARMLELLPGVDVVGDIMTGDIVVAQVDTDSTDTSTGAATNSTGSGELVELTSTASEADGQQWLRVLWAIALVCLALLLCFLLYWMVRSRRIAAKQAASSDTTISGTSSTYLPLDAEPTTGGFDAMATAIDVDTTKEAWTLPDAPVSAEHDEFLARTLPNIDQRNAPSTGSNQSTDLSHDEKTRVRPNNVVPGPGSQLRAQEVDDKTRLRPDTHSGFAQADDGSDTAPPQVPVGADDKTRLRPTSGGTSQVTGLSGGETDATAAPHDEDRTVLRPKTDSINGSEEEQDETRNIVDDDNDATLPAPKVSMDTFSEAAADPFDDATLPRQPQVPVASQSSDTLSRDTNSDQVDDDWAALDVSAEKGPMTADDLFEEDFNDGLNDDSSSETDTVKKD